MLKNMNADCKINLEENTCRQMLAVDQTKTDMEYICSNCPSLGVSTIKIDYLQKITA